MSEFGRPKHVSVPLKAWNKSKRVWMAIATGTTAVSALFLQADGIPAPTLKLVLSSLAVAGTMAQVVLTVYYGGSVVAPPSFTKRR